MSESDSLPLVAYSTGSSDDLEMPIISATARREWMNFHDKKAYHCLPLTIANQLGWFLLNPVGFVAEWQDETPDAPISITFDEPISDGQKAFLRAYFGSGILTWHIPYVFRTPPGYNLLAHGPANWIKDGIQALEGLVESDWVEATFTMNWKFTRAHHPVRFEKGEPFCMITPVRRGEIERFEPSVDLLENNPPLDEAHRVWSDQRRAEVSDGDWRQRLAIAFNRPFDRKYNLSYIHGQTAAGETLISDHQMRLDLKPFKQLWQKKFYHLLNNKGREDATHS